MLKKIFLVIILMLCVNTQSFATDYSTYCVEPYDLSNKAVRGLSNATGTTLIAQNIANSIIKKSLRDSAGAKGIKVKMKSYSANDLLAGRFKSLTMTGKNLDFAGTYLKSFNAKTVCGFNYIQATKQPVVFKENFIMTYEMTITDEDLRKTVLSQNYLTFLNSVNMRAGRINLFELKDVDVKLKDSKLWFYLKMQNSVFGHKLPMVVDVSTNVKVQNGKIKVTELTFEDTNTKLNLTQFTNLLNLINPLKFSVDVLGNNQTKVEISTVELNGDKMLVDGTIFAPKTVTKR